MELFKTGFWSGQTRVTFPLEEAVRASVNIQLVRVGLVISVDREYGNEIDHVTSALVTPL